MPDPSPYSRNSHVFARGEDSSEIYDDSCLRVEHKNYYLSCQGTPVTLTKTQFRVISRLARNINQIVTVKELWDYAWDPTKALNIKSVHVFVSRLRRKLEPLGLRLDSVLNVGYILSHGSCCGTRKADYGR